MHTYCNGGRICSMCDLWQSLIWWPWNVEFFHCRSSSLCQSLISVRPKLWTYDTNMGQIHRGVCTSHQKIIMLSCAFLCCQPQPLCSLMLCHALSMTEHSKAHRGLLSCALLCFWGLCSTVLCCARALACYFMLYCAQVVSAPPCFAVLVLWNAFLCFTVLRVVSAPQCFAMLVLWHALLCLTLV